MDLALQMHLRSVQSCFSHSWMLAGFFLLTFWEFDEKKNGTKYSLSVFFIEGQLSHPHLWYLAGFGLTWHLL